MGRLTTKGRIPTLRSLRSRVVPSKVTVAKSGVAGDAAFVACLQLGRKTNLVGQVCAYGRNPRQALANMLRKGFDAVHARRGAFQGTRRR